MAFDVADEGLQWKFQLLFAVDPGFKIMQQWIALCEHFESEKFKIQSIANTENRKNLEVSHTSGGKSYCQRIYELEQKQNVDHEADDGNMEENQEGNKNEPIEMKLYFDTHHKKDGTWTHPKAEENYEQMKTIFAQAIEDGIEMTGRQILEKVLKPKSGYIRGLGHGVKPRNKVSELQSLLHAERLQSEKQVSDLTKRIGTQDEQIRAQNITIDKLTQSQEELKSWVENLMQQRS
ncbi:hypothetical protein M5689_000969 [Euphorbia peplus]|nr:hypothetical protein M5689_000969 [Euphorbia peplus]